MRYERILVRYGDLTLKGRNRGRFERQMEQQIKRALAPFTALTYTKIYGRLYIHLHEQAYEPVAERLKDVFGIISFSPVLAAKPELEAIREKALALMQEAVKQPSTFKVSARRTWKPFPHGSQEMNHLVGSHVLRAIPDLTVDVRNPDVQLNIDIQQEAAYLYNVTVPGAGGFPFGTNGKALLLLSGGIDSPVAGYMGLRKGLELEAVHFHSYPFTSQQAKDKVIELAKRLSYYAGAPFKLHMVSFTEMQTVLAQQKQDNLIITMMRRAMLRITEQLAGKYKAGGIVTGESLGQVASQTLGSMNVIGKACTLPLIKPLIMMDKNEIIHIAEQIGTFETSILPYEDCCTLFLPKSPSTNPNLGVVEKVEASIENYDQLLADAVASTDTIVLTPDEPLNAPAGESSPEDDWF
ncbi:tRNA uracil 4-sulfurtransferase ThiI [Paenibacillus protaetiae]|uniref:Probable tRNA sulfurtransferase n=1 Tax=Paenibacillus protaetiae TaxID=2509456 RepID=A0A4P6F4T1_9BACL|nr:tRNA uracil 4-sulfurtransferase ThiI [Paenibacillus protaetiae]QAY65398.1 tRNA 4-thiouridine(8) synthase ThiI [Paenibacillus protaetiae]